MKLNNLDWNKLRTFVTVADNGSVTAAADVLGRTPSAVSQSLSGLERSLDIRLFHRVGKRLVPTVAGERLWHGVREHQENLLATVRDIAASDEVPRGPVRVGLFLGFPRARLSSLVAGFAKSFPEVSTRLVFAPESELDPVVRAGAGAGHRQGVSPRSLRPCRARSSSDHRLLPERAPDRALDAPPLAATAD